MKTYFLVGAVVGIVVGLTAGFSGVHFNIWLFVGAGVAAALIAGWINNRKKG